MTCRFNIVLSSLLAILFLLGSTGRAVCKNVTPLKLGAAAPDFSLPGVDGKTYSLADFADAEVLVVIFTCNHCPTAQAYEDRIIQLHADYKDRGVALVAISPNDPQAVRLDELGYTDVGDSFEDMKIHARDKNFKFPYLYDGETQKTSAAYGVLATPHVFIFDAERKLRYIGGIDDSDVGPVKSRGARNAVEALLKNEPVPEKKTRVFGCSTKWSDKRKSVVQSLKKWNAEPVSLDTIDESAVRELVSNDTKKYRLINIWATWCIPCVEELEELVTINRMYRRRPFEAITISLDGAANRDRALKILEEKHVSCNNYIFNSTDRDRFAEALDKKWRGPLPYTLLVAPGGKIIYRKHDAFDPLKLKQTIVNELGRTYASR